MNFPEKRLEDFIYKSDNQLLRSRGLGIINGKRLRQVKLQGYGTADLIEIQRYACANAFGIILYELKAEKLRPKALFQAFRYMTGIREYVESRDLDLKYDFIYHIALIGSGVSDEKDWLYATTAFGTGVFIYTYEEKENGVFFKCIESTNNNK